MEGGVTEELLNDAACGAPAGGTVEKDSLSLVRGSPAPRQRRARECTNKVWPLALRTAAWCRNSVPCVHKRRISRPPLLSLELRPSAATRRDCRPEIVVPPHSPAIKPSDGEVRPCSGGGASWSAACCTTRRRGVAEMLRRRTSAVLVYFTSRWASSGSAGCVRVRHAQCAANHL